MCLTDEERSSTQNRCYLSTWWDCTLSPNLASKTTCSSVKLDCANSFLQPSGVNDELLKAPSLPIWSNQHLVYKKKNSDESDTNNWFSHYLCEAHCISTVYEMCYINKLDLTCTFAIKYTMHPRLTQNEEFSFLGNNMAPNKRRNSPDWRGGWSTAPSLEVYAALIRPLVWYFSSRNCIICMEFMTEMLMKCEMHTNAPA